MACRKCGKMKCSCGGMVNKKPVKKSMGGMVTKRVPPRTGGQPGGPKWSDTGPNTPGMQRLRPPMKQRVLGAVSDFRQKMAQWRASRPQRPERPSDREGPEAVRQWRASRPQRRG